MAYPINPISRDVAEQAVRTLLNYLGEDPDRPGLKDTPKRFVKMLDELTRENSNDVDATVFEAATSNDMVVVRDIALNSLCEHHLAFYGGKISIGYIPNNKVLGLSKFARIVAKYQAALTIQEKLTRDIADAIAKATGTKDVAVISEATHSCMVARGARAHGTSAIASVMLGAFREDASSRSEFLRLIGR